MDLKHPFAFSRLTGRPVTAEAAVKGEYFLPDEAGESIPVRLVPRHQRNGKPVKAFFAVLPGVEGLGETLEHSSAKHLFAYFLKEKIADNGTLYVIVPGFPQSFELVFDSSFGVYEVQVEKGEPNGTIPDLKVLRDGRVELLFEIQHTNSVDLSKSLKLSHPCIEFIASSLVADILEHRDCIRAVRAWLLPESTFVVAVPRQGLVHHEIWHQEEVVERPLWMEITMFTLDLAKLVLPKWAALRNRSKTFAKKPWSDQIVEAMNAVKEDLQNQLQS